MKAVPEKEKRVSWLTQEHAAALLNALIEHLSDMALFSLETGLRRANVTGIKWSHIDLAGKRAWIHADEAKARKAIAVPLSDVGVEVLRRQRFAMRKPEFVDYVFVYRGKPIFKSSTRAWRRACDAVGLSNFRWHDLRHTWASWMVQNGTPTYVLQELGGWGTERMVKRYTHLSCKRKWTKKKGSRR